MATRDCFLDEWENLTCEHDRILPDRWRAEARLQQLDEHGYVKGLAREYACRWNGCRYISDRHAFPVSGYVEGLRQYAPGRYRLTIAGKGIEPLNMEIEVPDLDGGALILCHQLKARPIERER